MKPDEISNGFSSEDAIIPPNLSRFSQRYNKPYQSIQNQDRQVLIYRNIIEPYVVVLIYL